MADLVTHLACGLLVKALTRRPGTAAFLVGCALPDLAARVPSMALSALRHRGLPVPEAAIYAFYVLHMPLALIALTWLVASAFRAADRRLVWGNLLGGAALHLGLDLLQRHYGAGYMLLYPFSRWDWEAGWLGSESTVLAAPALAVAGAALWWRRAVSRRNPDAS